jgi:hypothetical protein
LENAIAAAGLKCDKGVTTDRCRLLRPPGTSNFKKPDTPLDVSFEYDSEQDFAFADLKQALKPYLSQLTTSRAMPFITDMKEGAKFRQSKHATQDDYDDLGAGVGEHKASPRDIDRVALVCPHMARVLETAGAGYSETLWRDHLRVALWSKDREQTAHRLSQGHDGYDPIKTEEKLKEVEKYQRGGDLGFPRCKTIQEHGANECSGCAWLKFDKSPLNAKAIIPDVVNSQASQYQPMKGGHYSACIENIEQLNSRYNRVKQGAHTNWFENMGLEGWHWDRGTQQSYQVSYYIPRRPDSLKLDMAGGFMTHKDGETALFSMVDEPYCKDAFSSAGVQTTPTARATK